MIKYKSRNLSKRPCTLSVTRFDKKTRQLASTDIVSANQFCWRCLSKGWQHFFFKKTVFHQIMYYFQIWKFFDFFAKIQKVEKPFSKNKIIWYAFYSKNATWTDFEKINRIFPKGKKERNRKISTGLSKLHGMCPDEHFRVFENIFHAWMKLNKNVNAISKYGMKKRTIWVDDFPSVFWIWSEK